MTANGQAGVDVERRQAVRHRVLKRGLIVLNGRSTIACTVRNQSDSGALLRIETSFRIPDVFELVLDGRRRRCRVARRTMSEIGVAFEY